MYPFYPACAGFAYLIRTKLAFSSDKCGRRVILANLNSPGRLFMRLFFNLALAGGIATGILLSGVVSAQEKPTPPGFTRLFDGTSLAGWKLVGGYNEGYVPKNGVLVCPADGGGNLFTEKEYSDFVFRFDFKLDHAGNNGVGIRAPFGGDAAYVGMECQVLDDSDPAYAHLEAGQYHSSIYKVVPAKRGSLRPVGEWNTEEIKAVGRHIKITVNGKVTVDADLNSVSDPQTFAEHPGFRRDRGHIGFLGHGPSEVQFRNVFVRDLTKPEKDNVAPDGFKLLFNGKNLDGWKGLVKNPVERAKMPPDELKLAEKAATVEALKHWTVEKGEIGYDGKNDSLCTMKDYADFEMLVDWKIEPHGDSGIYLRGSPQVQIWDDEPAIALKVGSGGLYNNQKNPSNPTVRADNPPGQWNRFRILMIADKVTVYLNNVLVVQNVTMENYWERYKPIYPAGQIELQHHGSHLRFKNIYIREIKQAAK